MAVIKTDGCDGERALFDSTAVFLRALAIGHPSLDDPAWENNQPEERYRNHALAQWLHEELRLSIPTSAAEITVTCHDEFAAKLQALRST